MIRLFITGAINYTPSLPSIKLNLLKSIPLAYIVKFIFTYEEVGSNPRPYTGNHVLYYYTD